MKATELQFDWSRAGPQQRLVVCFCRKDWLCVFVRATKKFRPVLIIVFTKFVRKVIEHP